MLRSACFALALASIALAPARACAQAHDHRYQTWVSATIQGNVHDDVQLYVDLNGRFYDDLHPYQVLVRPAIGVRVAAGMYLWLGYGWTPSWTAQRAYVDEHRLWEQWSWDPAGIEGGVRLLVRTRLEQRARFDRGTDVGLRIRQFVRLLVPFAPRMPVHLSLWDEAFVALTDSGDARGRLWQRLGFDQNRLFVGIGWNVVEGVRVEAGYLNQWLVRHDSTDNVHHVLALNTFFTVR